MNGNKQCRIGFAEADITPDFPVELIGCYRPDSTSRGVLHPLSAQVLFMESDENRYCLAAIDSLGLTVGLADEVRAIIAQELRTDMASVMLCFSHTHSAPAPLAPMNGQRYFELLCRHIRECAAEALKSLRPCTAAWAMGETDIGENRREGCTVVDRRLGALQLTDADSGLPRAVVLRVTAHANVLRCSNNKLSSDYFYAARNSLKNFFGCPVMLIQGAAGNVKPVGVDKITGGEIADLELIAKKLLYSTKRLQFIPVESLNLEMREREIAFQSDVPTPEEAVKIAEEAKRLCGIVGAEWLRECTRLREAGISVQVTERRIQFLFLGGGCLCGVPDELFCEISLEASRRAGTHYLFLNGYTDGCTGYLPHGAEWEKGGYETLYSYLRYYAFHGHVMPYNKDTAERIVDLVCTEWENYITGKY